MDSVFIIKGTMMCIRGLNNNDIKYSYYELMNLLSNDVRILIINGEFHDIGESNYKIHVVEDTTSHIILGIGVVYIENSNTNLSKVGNIRHIGIQRNYINTELETKVMNYLKKYCLVHEKCIKLNIQI